MFKGFAVLGNMTAACMDVSEVEQPALLAAKICGDSIGGIFGALGNIWWWKSTQHSYRAVSLGLRYEADLPELQTKCGAYTSLRLQ